MGLILPPWKLMLLGLSTSFLAQFNLSTQYAIVNVPEPILKNFTNSSFHTHFRYWLSGSGLISIWGFFASTFPIGLAIGSLGLGRLANKLGRRFTLFVLANVIVLIGSAAMLAAYYWWIFELMILGRLILGVASGLSASVLPVYLMECSPYQVRGFMASIRGVFSYLQTGLAVGISMKSALGSETLWGYCLAFQGFIAMVQLLSTPLFPESPSYDYNNGRQDRAAKTAKRYFPSSSNESVESATEFLERLELEAESRNSENTPRASIRDLRRSNWLRKALLLAVVIGISKPLSGLAVVEMYSASLFKTIGLSEVASNYASLGFQFSGAAVAFVGLVTVEHVGRRPLMLYTVAGSGFLWLFIAIIRFVQTYSATHPWQVWLSLVLYCCFTFVHPIGSTTLAWFISAELVPQSASAVVSSISVFAATPFAVFSLMAYPAIDTKIGAVSNLIVFVLPLAVIFTILYRFLPETKQRTTTEILTDLGYNSGGEEFEGESGDNDEAPLMV